MKPLAKEYAVLISALAAQMTLEALDEIQGTNAYRHELKLAGNRFEKELTKYTNEIIKLLWGKDDKAMYLLMDYYKQVVKKLVHIRPEDVGVIDAIIDKYLASPAKVLKRLEIRLVDSGKIEEPTN